MNYFRIIIGAFLACLLAGATWALDTRATTALVIDQGTGTVLFAKDPDRPIPPASMSKLMTLDLLFEALKSGRVTLDTEFRVSQRAHDMGGSKMFVQVGDRVTVENLIQGIIVQSGNDACVVVAENLAGTEEEFARLMTERAAQLGMVNSSFGNATGWPDPRQRMSARDLVFLANRIITEFPEYYKYFGEHEFTWADITQKNRNPLLFMNIGADGLKTGHTSEAGYGLVGSVVQGNRRVVFMLGGMASERERAEEGEKIANWAFRNFTQKTLLKGDKPVAEAEVWLGNKATVGLVAKDDVIGLIPYTTTEDVTMAAEFNGPLEAPISAGDEVAKLRVNVPGMEPVYYPLYAASDVAKGGIAVRFKGAARRLAKRSLALALGAGQ